jgi:hypothetical protein
MEGINGMKENSTAGQITWQQYSSFAFQLS